MYTPAEALFNYLDSLPSFTKGTNLFLGNLPETNNNVLTMVKDTGAVTLNPAYKRDEFLVQFIVRGTPPNLGANSYSTAYNKVQEIFETFIGSPNLTIDSVEYFAFNAIGGINNLGFDSSFRPLFSLNIRATKDNAGNGPRENL